MKATNIIGFEKGKKVTTIHAASLAGPTARGTHYGSC